MTDHRHHPVPPPPPSVSPVPQPSATGPAQGGPSGELWRTKPDLTGAMPAAAGGHAGRRGMPGWVVALAAATAVLSVVAFVTVLLWPSGEPHETLPSTGPLAFHPFEPVARIEFSQASRTAFTRVYQDRVYVASEQGGDLELVAADVVDGAERWRQRITGSPRWVEVFPVAGAVVVVGADPDGPSQMYVHDAGGGAELWRQAVDVAEDWVSAAAGNLVWYDAGGGWLRGFDTATGTEEWSRSVSSDAATVWALTGADLALPTDTAGNLGVTASDPRLVVVDEDRSAYVIDARNGTVISQAGNVARTRDHFVAYDGRLFVANDERGFQLVSYDLGDLSAVPQVHYRAGAEQYPEELEVCGPGRVCLLETEGFSRDTTEVVVVDTEVGNERWREHVPDARTMVPVGPWLMVMGRDGPVLGFDETGQQVLDRPGVIARLNADNMLVFASSLTSSERDVSVAGVSVTGEQPLAELGQLTGVVGDQCSWNYLHLACPDRDGATIWRFAQA